jgi:hypothetical protein
VPRARLAGGRVVGGRQHDNRDNGHFMCRNPHMPSSEFRPGTPGVYAPPRRIPSAHRRRLASKLAQLYHGLHRFGRSGHGPTQPASIDVAPRQAGENGNQPSRHSATGACATPRGEGHSQGRPQPPRMRRLTTAAAMTSPSPARRIGMTSAPVNGRLLRVSAWVSESTVLVGCAADGIWPSFNG